MTLEAHVSRWWDVANQRRQRLILQKHGGGGLTKRQEAELVLLQGVADMVMSYASPLDFRPLEAMVRKAERLAARIAKVSLKSNEGR